VATHSPRVVLSAQTSLCALLTLSLLLLIFPSVAAAQTWGNPVWSDEFNGAVNSPINPANWQYDTGILNVNNEVEYYCAPGSNTAPCVANTPNAYIDGDGHLIIRAVEITSSVTPYSGSWTSARLNTGNNLQNFTYGRLESSMTLPVGAGLWPAYWALGNNINSVGWPASGEMDFMENVPASGGLGPTAIRSTIHGGNSSSSCYCGGNGLGLSYTFPSNDPNGIDVTSFHAYGAIWSYNMVQFYVDDPTNIFFVRTASDIPSGFTWDFNHPFFLLLNLAVGGTGSWPGQPNGSTPSPAVMTVDYVRYYQPVSAVLGPSMSGTSISVQAGTAGSSTVSLTSTSGSGRVYLSCTTTAPKATCAINTADPLDAYTVDFSNSATGTATVNLTTTANTAVLIKPNSRFDRRALLACTFPLLGFVFVSVVFVPTKWSRSIRRGMGGTGLMLALLMHPGCGGSSGRAGSGPVPDNGTTPGNYSVTVNAYTVSNTTGNPDSTASIVLTVN
jgi:beta-glucanase (GH16 family)